MECARIGNTRWALRVAVGTLVACAALAVTASSALAKRDRDRDSYTVNITPATALKLGLSGHFAAGHLEIAVRGFR